nr:serine:threonine protein phosphatase PP1 beta [Hymenolepis microstoma]
MQKGGVPIGISRLPDDDGLFLSRMKDRFLAGLYRRGENIIMKQEEIERVCGIIKPIIQSEPTLLELESPIYILGDIHGQFHDLLRIFDKINETNDAFLFLGDYVDRGPQSIEVITFLFVLKALNPDKYYLLRGNHEDGPICTKFGFREEVVKRYNAELFATFVDVFNYLPIAATIDEKDFCVHGGLCRELLAHGITHIRQFFEPIQRPIEVNDSSFVRGLLWSDPKPDKYGIRSVGFSPNRKRGGDIEIFGHSVTDRFLARFEFEKVMRAHEFCPKGKKEDHGGKVMTFFAAPGYAGSSNFGGFALRGNDFDGSRFCDFVAICPHDV